MKDQILIVGDIAGRYNELMKLVRKGRDQFGDFSLVSVGDLVDRGKDSDKVVEYFRMTDDAYAIKGNHEDMFIDFVKGDERYRKAFGWSVYLNNGGKTTIESYYKRAVENAVIDPSVKLTDEQYEAMAESVPKEHIEFLESCPTFIEHEDSFGKIYITHAPIHPASDLERCKGYLLEDEWSLCWNRSPSKRIPGVDMQFHGHNANRDVEWNKDGQGVYGCNMDTSFGRKLTGVLWPSLETIEVDYQEI